MILLPALTNGFLWASRSFVFAQHYKMALWTCGFSCIWCGYWMIFSSVLTCNSFFIFLYLFFMIHLMVHKKKIIKERKKFPLGMMFVQYIFITGIKITPSFYLQWTLICATYLSLIYGTDIKKYHFLGIALPCSGFSREISSLVCEGMYNFGSYCLLKSKRFNWRISSEHYQWIQWISGIVYILAPPPCSWKHGVIQKGTSLFFLGILFFKNQYVYARFLIHILSIQWMGFFNTSVSFKLAYLGCTQWAHYVIYHDQESSTTKNFAQIGSGILFGSLVSTGVWGIVYGVKHHTHVYVCYGQFVFYVLCCLMYGQSIYSKLRSRKYNTHTEIEVYAIFTGVLIWNMFNGLYLGKISLF
ncbi:hypothetical protein [Holospora undulata]|uniref:Uncharacterized protein n=3 Tax=Holospora TaxID=44747 RepID=A0A061JI28_9PROT|nr:hypothetical protein [Holospora undulata]ETZ04634.1 hypothetical protein K737_300954 [Holospora undulata HU1]GAJ46571.1 hypothetical protein HE1_00906 [Holospora elegans E1]